MHQPVDPEMERERRRLAALAASALAFRKAAADAMDQLLVGMIGDNADIDGFKFRTPNGRNVMVVLAFGDDAVGELTDALNGMLDTRNGEASDGGQKQLPGPGTA